MMKVRNVAVAGLLATTLVGASAAPHLATIAPVYADEGTNAQAQASADQIAATNGEARAELGALIEGTAEKEEVIYASMTATGAVKNLYVVNELFSDTPAMVKDFGAYERVLNLTDEATLAQEPDSVVCVVEEESFVYQGDLASSELPWKVNITYVLDGVTVTPEELAGSTGELTLSITTEQNGAIDPSYFDNYMLQITCALPIEHATKIEAEDGQIALSGSDTTVAFTCMPGKSSSCTLTAQVKDFEMEGISIAAIPFSMAIDLPDSSALVAQFDALIEGADQLDRGARELREGTNAFEEGAHALDQGTNQLQSGASELSSGLAAYVSGITRIEQGLAQVASGSHAFAEKLAELSQASAGISQSLAATETQLQALVAQIQASALPDAEKTALLQQIAGLSGQLGGLKEYVAGVGALSDGYAGLDSSLDQLSAGLGELSRKGSELAGGSTELSAGIDELAGSTGGLAEGADRLAEGAGKLSEGTAQLKGESQKIPDKVQSEIDALMSDYDKSDFEPKSFVDPRNTNVTLVQFVMTTEAIHVPDPEPEVVEEEDETLLSRFFALFS